MMAKHENNAMLVVVKTCNLIVGHGNVQAFSGHAAVLDFCIVQPLTLLTDCGLNN